MEQASSTIEQFISNNLNIKDHFSNLEKFFIGWNKFNKNTIKRRLQSNETKVLYQLGSSRLIEYKTSTDNEEIVLFLPSLINKYYILDLYEEISLLKFFDNHKIKTLFIEWQEPIYSEYSYNFEDYFIKRVVPYIEFLSSFYCKKITIIGYCLGGVFACMAASIMPNYVNKVILLATPYDFRKLNIPIDINKEFYKSEKSDSNLVPPAFIHNFFSLIDPLKIINKFINFADIDINSPEGRKFLAIESWVNDGLSITENFYNDLQENFLIKGGLASRKTIFSNCKFNLSKIEKKIYIVIPIKDKIVPPISSIAFIDLMADITVKYYNSGHVGIVTNRKAFDVIYKPMIDWINN